MIVLIDDLRSFKVVTPEDVIVLRTSKEALQWLSDLEKGTQIVQLWFDHDLGLVDGEEDTVMPVVKALLNRIQAGNKLEIGTVLVHSSNPVGAENIQAQLAPHYAVMKVRAKDYLTA